MQIRKLLVLTIAFLSRRAQCDSNRRAFYFWWKSVLIFIRHFSLRMKFNNQVSGNLFMRCKLHGIIHGLIAVYNFSGQRVHRAGVPLRARVRGV